MIISVIPRVMDMSQGPWISYLEFAVTDGAHGSETHLPLPFLDLTWVLGNVERQGESWENQGEWF